MRTSLTFTWNGRSLAGNPLEYAENIAASLPMHGDHVEIEGKLYHVNDRIYRFESGLIRIQFICEPER